MKQKIYLVTCLLLIGGTLFAQPKRAENPQLLIKSQTGLMAPSWSPDGSMIAVTGNNYAGIWVANADGSNLHQITNESGAGYKMLWNEDSKQILAAPAEIDNKGRSTEVKIYNVADGTSKVVVAKTRHFQGSPLWTSDNDVQYSDKVSIKNLRGTKNEACLYSKMVSNPSGVTSTEAVLNRFAGKILMNPAMSVDKSKICFQIYGQGAWVCNADGENLKSLGYGVRPAWLPDNKTVILVKTVDNGNVVTSAELCTVDVESGKTESITENLNIIPFAPAVSPDGKKVAVENLGDGQIYIMNLKY